MSTRVLLVAHGATEATRRTRFPLDEQLDPHGSTAVASAAAADPWPERARVMCGPERRCRETAGVLAQPTEELRDWDVGRWAGRTLDEVVAVEAAAAHLWRNDLGYRGHGGESLSDLLARVAQWLDAMAALPGSAVAVTSPAVLRAGVVTVLSAPAAAFWRVDVAPLSRVSLSAYVGRWNLRT